MIAKNQKLNTVELLENLGLEEKEAEIYLALLNNGAMLPQHIAQATGLKRTTLYNIFPLLIEKGIIKEIVQGKRRLMSANSPEDLFKSYEERYKEIKENIAELAAVYRMQGLKPKIEVYEGLDGLKKVFLDTLKTKKELLIVSQITEYHSRLLNWIYDEYVPMRVKAGIAARAISEERENKKEYMLSREEELREVKYVPWDKFHFKMEMMIYGDNVSFSTNEKGAPLVGIIIRSRQIAGTLAALFNLAWEGAERYQKISNF